jgi:hypothetical protein
MLWRSSQERTQGGVRFLLGSFPNNTWSCNGNVPVYVFGAKNAPFLAITPLTSTDGKHLTLAILYVALRGHSFLPRHGDICGINCKLRKHHTVPWKRARCPLHRRMGVAVSRSVWEKFLSLREVRTSFSCHILVYKDPTLMAVSVSPETSLHCRKLGLRTHVLCPCQVGHRYDFMTRTQVADMTGRCCKCAEEAIAGVWQGVVLQLGGWSEWPWKTTRYSRYTDLTDSLEVLTQENMDRAMKIAMCGVWLWVAAR